MLARLLVILALLTLTMPAHALDACFTRSTGPWRGTVLNAGVSEILNSEFHVAADGGLAGSYTVEDSVPFGGTLSGFHQTGACEADFTWTDRYGSGSVHVSFTPDQGRFDGIWGLTVPVANWIFTGRRSGGMS